MRTAVAKLLCNLGERAVLFEINQNEFNKWVRLVEDRLESPLNLPGDALHRYKDRDDAVGTRSATRDETVSARQSKPRFKENQQCGERSKPANEEKYELEHGAHTSLLIYL